MLESQIKEQTNHFQQITNIADLKEVFQNKHKDGEPKNGLSQKQMRELDFELNEEDQQNQNSDYTPIQNEESNQQKKKKKNKNKKKKNKNGEQIVSNIRSEQSNPINNFKKQGSSVLFEKVQSTDGYLEDQLTSAYGKQSSQYDREEVEGDNDVNREVNSEKADFTPLKEKLNDSFFEDQDSSEDEGIQDYKIGGYHPIHVGEILLDRYLIIQKLGWGHFSTVWLTKDLLHNSYVAMKVQKSAQHYLEAAYDEVDILDSVASNWKTEEWKQSVDKYYKDDKQLNARLSQYGMNSTTSHCAQLLNSFIHQGPNGKHFIMVFEILGVNFLEIIKRYDYKGVPMPIVRRLARQCLIGLDYMHRMCKIIHTDFKPENVVICLTDEQVREIAKTGQLTGSKIHNSLETVRNFNMKISKSIKPSKVIKEEQATKPQTEERQRDKQEEPFMQKELEQKLDQLATNQVQQKDNLTAKQKKNQKKKQKRKEKKEQLKTGVNTGINTITQTPSGKQENAQNQEQIAKPIQKFDEIVKPQGDSQEEKNSQQKQLKQQHIKKGSGTFGKVIQDIDLEQKLITSMQDQANLIGKKKRGPRIDENVMVKICDMGNGCWTYHHFTPEIQTRQYRSPEVIIGGDYNTSADMWSFACTIFEMVTGDFLFEPKKGPNYDKDEDHLAQMMELLGRMPKNMAMSGKNSKEFFNSKGHLRNIQGLNYWPLKKVLMEKYKIKEAEAEAFADFLRPMLEWYPEKRATAQQMLDHHWLKMDDNYEFKYTDKEYEVLMLKKEIKEKMKSRPGQNTARDDSEIRNQDMGELAYSEEDLNEADYEESNSSLEDSHSLIESDEEREQVKKRKDKEAKINNSFTGPYPTDPSDFKHTDKGPNFQFEQLFLQDKYESVQSKPHQLVQ